MKTKLAILLIGVSMAFISCKKDLDQPIINEFPTGNEWSVGRILDSLNKLSSYQFDEYFDSNAKNAVVKGYVIADEIGGNIYRTVYLRGEDGKCVALYRKGSSDGGSEEFNVRIGDYIGYSLYGSIISTYSGLPQIQVQEQDPNKLIVIYQRGCTDKVQPKNVTISDIETGDYLCDLVRINDVQFESYEGLTYAVSGTNTNRDLISCSGESVIVRTSGYASFAGEPLPSGKGYLTSIVSVFQPNYGSPTWQLLIRTTADVRLTNPRCGEAGEIMDMPYTQLFTSSFGTYFAYSVTGDQVWTIDHAAAKMTGYSGGSNANEDWLISSPVNVTDVLHAKAVFSYAAQYSGIDRDITIQISSDYEYGDAPTTATWTELPDEFANTNGWTFTNKEVSLDDFIGQTVTLAVKYISTDSKSRTIEIEKISIEEGEAGGGSGGDVYFNQPLLTQASYDLFSEYSVEGDQRWHFDERYGAVMSGFANNISYANEDWFISPAIDLSASTAPVLSFEHARGPAGSINVGVAEGYYTVWITNGYITGQNPTQFEWTELTGINHGTSAWGYVNSGDIVIPSEYKTADCYIAFKYLSIDGASATWEVKNVLIKD